MPGGSYDYPHFTDEEYVAQITFKNLPKNT